jgi:hypothetical protein
MNDWITQIFNYHARLDHTKLLLFHERLIIQFDQFSCTIRSYKLYNFSARLDHTNYYYFMQD